MEAILELHAITKAFSGIHAVLDVTLSVARGRVLGLIGQNGAGKSTLMNIVGGVIEPDSGTMTLAGAPYAPRNPTGATRRRIAFIHQELSLFSNLTIAENIYLTGFPERRFGPVALIDRSDLARRAGALLQSVGLNLDPNTLLDRLSPGERQLVEVARALRLDAELLIFDEPTTSLTARETERLFSLIRQLRTNGKSIVFISHILPDVMALADDIAVMRDGELASHGSAADFDTARMITLMLGRPIDQIHPERQSRLRGDSLLSVHGLSSPGIIKNVSFALHSGEVVGLFGLMGSGRTELAQMLFGLDNHASGEVAVRDQPLPAVHSPRQSIRHGIAFVTENRREEGLMMDGSVGDNIVLAALPSLAVTPIEFVDRFRARHAALELSDALQIKTSSIEAPARSLSGGNQQKVVVAKWLMAEPSIFILDEPTRGIDVGAKYEIYSFIDRLTKGGSGILFISSELDELMAVSDRILVMSRGEVVDEFAREAFDSQRILAAAFREQGAAA